MRGDIVSATGQWGGGGMKCRYSTILNTNCMVTMGEQRNLSLKLECVRVGEMLLMENC
jgi:hypothetical protein